MDFQQIKLHRQRSRESTVTRPAAAELCLHAIQAAAPVPVVVAFAKDGAGVGGTLISPELTVDIPHPAEPASPGFAGAMIHVEPGWDGAMNIQVVGWGGIAAVNLGRLGGGQTQDSVGFLGEGLDVRARVVPGELQLAGGIERDVIGVVEIVVRIIVHVILVQRATNAEAGAGRHEVAHAGVAAIAGVGRVMHRQGVVIAAALPVVD